MDSKAPSHAVPFLVELVYVQLHRTVRRAMGVIGDLERDSMNPWQKMQRALRYMGSLDAEVFAIRDHVEELAKLLGVALPSRAEAQERSRGANAKPTPVTAEAAVADSDVLAR